MAKGPAPQPTVALQEAHVIFQPPGQAPLSVRVEVAKTVEERNRGLMFRRFLAPNDGMIFIYDKPEKLVFWMRNTLIPLDMIFVGEDLRVTGVVENTQPLTDTPRAVDKASQFCVEVNAGFAARHGIGPQTQVKFENITR